MSYTQDLKNRGMKALAREREQKTGEFMPVDATISGHAWIAIDDALFKAGIGPDPLHRRVALLSRQYRESRVKVMELIEENEQLRKRLGEYEDV